MPFVSYAQNFEDVMLWRALKSLRNGFYIDIGACDPEIDSVTRAFYDHGWSGINIEPVSQWYERLQEQRPRDINIRAAAGSDVSETVLYELPDTGLSTQDKGTALRHEQERGIKAIESRVFVYTLTEICKRHCIGKPIHFMKIDVEGAEAAVLKGIEFSEIRPWIILIESTIPNKPVEDFSECSKLLEEVGYKFVYFDGLNRFYISPDHPELADYFQSPPNVFDDFTLSGTSSSSFVYLQRERISALTELQRTYEECLAFLAKDLGIKSTLHEATADFSRYEGDFVHLSLPEIRDRVQRLRAELEVTKAEFDRALRDGSYWKERADALENSISWKITWPVRKASALLQRLSTFIRKISNMVLYKPLKTALANPVFASKTTQFLLRRFPRVHRFLRGQAISANIMQDTGMSLYGARHLKSYSIRNVRMAGWNQEEFGSTHIPTEILIDRIYKKMQNSQLHE